MSDQYSDVENKMHSDVLKSPGLHLKIDLVSTCIWARERIAELEGKLLDMMGEFCCASCGFTNEGVAICKACGYDNIEEA